MFNSPFIIPVVAMLIPIVAIIGGVWSKVSADRTRADQRMAMLARGIPLAEIENVLGAAADSDRRDTAKDPLRSLGNARRAAIVLIATGLGFIVFFVILEKILEVREVLAGAAAALIPLVIGLGFVVDYFLQKRDLSRFGLEVDATKN